MNSAVVRKEFFSAVRQLILKILGRKPNFSSLLLLLLLFSLALQPSAGYGLLVPRGFLISHNDAPQSVGLYYECPARSRDLYLTTHNRHNRNASMTMMGFEALRTGHIQPPKGNILGTYFCLGHAVAQWLRHCATNRKVAG
jgi:hypothetical protein